jgi:23S rRNA (adenine2503-C2)-methyltransferase
MSTQDIPLARRSNPVLAARPALSELAQVELEDWAVGRGLPRYRARQIYRALWTRGVQTISEVRELPAGLREELELSHRTRTLEGRAHLVSPRDGSEKVLFGLHDGAAVESVLIPSADGRHTVCVSSQAGCPAACSFCATGLAGFFRNLTAGEIADQVLYFAGRLGQKEKCVTNVVFMGMGEPLLNVAAVRRAIHRLTDPEGFGLGDRHITVSTVGIVPQIRRYADWAGQVNLAVSLHAANDELRTELVPYNKRFPIASLIEAVRDYVERTHRRVSFEYVLLKGVNDSLPLAVELADLLRPLGGYAHVNLIPWNPFREGRFVRSEGPDAAAFVAALRQHGVNATIRYSKGLDISAACGQLREQAAKTASQNAG